MPSFLLLESGDRLLLESGGGLLLQDSARFPLALIVDEFETVPETIKERTTPRATIQIVDELGVPVEFGFLDVALIAVRDSKTQTVVRSLENMLDADNDFDTDTVGTILWQMQVQDTTLLSRTATTEKRIVEMAFGWDSSDAGTLTDALTTTLGSRTITIDLPSHGLTGDEHHQIWLWAEDAVGGLTIFGNYDITPANVVDSDTLRIQANCPATANESSGGGTFRYWLNAKSEAAEVQYTINRVGAVC